MSRSTAKQLGEHIAEMATSDRSRLVQRIQEVIIEDRKECGATKDAQIAALREALRPFAKYADQYNEIPGVILIHDNVELWQDGHNVKLSVGDLRRARAAMEGVLFAPTPAPRLR